MAVAYSDLLAERSNQTKRDQVNVALTIVAIDIAEGSDTNDPPYDQTAGASDIRRTWVRERNVFNPDSALIDEVWNAMLALNVDAANIGVIQAATDANVKSNVEKVVDILAGN